MTESIGRNDLKAAVESGAVTLVDALPESYYRQQHLPGALNLVEAEVGEKAGSLLPDKDAAIVVYCASISCTYDQAVANRLTALGYTNVRKYADGIQDWVEAGLPVESGSTVRS